MRTAGSGPVWAEPDVGSGCDAVWYGPGCQSARAMAVRWCRLCRLKTCAPRGTLQAPTLANFRQFLGAPRQGAPRRSSRQFLLGAAVGFMARLHQICHFLVPPGRGPPERMPEKFLRGLLRLVVENGMFENEMGELRGGNSDFGDRNEVPAHRNSTLWISCHCGVVLDAQIMVAKVGFPVRRPKGGIGKSALHFVDLMPLRRFPERFDKGRCLRSPAACVCRFLRGGAFRRFPAVESMIIVRNPWERFGGLGDRHPQIKLTNLGALPSSMSTPLQGEAHSCNSSLLAAAGKEIWRV